MMENKNQHLEAIDASRPGTDDLADFPDTQRAIETDAELRRFSRFVAESDAQIQALMSDIEPPEGLVDRIHASLDADASPTLSVETTDFQVPRALNRRKLMAVTAGLAAVAACVLLVISTTPLFKETIDFDQLIAVYDQITVEKQAMWQRYEGSAGRTSLFPSRYLKTVPTRWMGLKTEIASATQVFELNQNAHVVVFRTKQRVDLPPRPLEKVVRRTGGRVFTAWTDGNAAYLVAVHGTEKQLRSLFSTDSLLAVGCWLDHLRQPI